jgi:hypothetical protein
MYAGFVLGAALRFEAEGLAKFSDSALVIPQPMESLGEVEMRTGTVGLQPNSFVALAFSSLVVLFVDKHLPQKSVNLGVRVQPNAFAAHADGLLPVPFFVECADEQGAYPFNDLARPERLAAFADGPFIVPLIVKRVTKVVMCKAGARVGADSLSEFTDCSGEVPLALEREAEYDTRHDVLWLEPDGFTIFANGTLIVS